MLEAIAQIEARTANLDLAGFRGERFTQLGVERCLEIISEASRHILDEVKAAYPSIPWRRVADIGNRIRHSYHSIDSEIVWLIVLDHLGELKAAILSMASDET